MSNEVTPFDVLGSGAGGPLTAPSPWLSYSGYIQYNNGAVVVGNPTGGSKTLGSINTQSLYLNGIIVNLDLYLPYTGGVLTGLLTLSQDPVAPLDAADKRYVDNAVTVINTTFGNYLPLAGGTMTGPLTLPANPTVNLQAATKQYVDSQLGFSFADAPSDGNAYLRLNAGWSNLVDAGTY